MLNGDDKNNINLAINYLIKKKDKKCIHLNKKCKKC